jgi:hypothetical protein
MLNTGKQHSEVQLPISEADLCERLGLASPGDVLQYHRGFLALDVVPYSHRLSDRERAELIKVARRARWASEKGLAHLLQRRHEIDDYAYLLVVRTRPKHEPVLLSEVIGPELSGAPRADGRLEVEP